MSTDFLQSKQTSRRGFLRGSGKLAAAGAIVGAFTVSPFSGSLQKALAAHCLDIDGDGDMDDVDVLQYALTLEHLEAEFYKEGQARFGPADFGAAFKARFGLGIGQSGGDRIDMLFDDIRDHEVAHVETLTQVIASLGGDPVEACVYDFGYTDIEGYIQLAMVFENTGVMAYDGSINCLTDPALIQAAATIATVEARHASFLNLLNATSPFPQAFDDTATQQEVLDAVAPFIVSCGNSSGGEDGGEASGRIGGRG